MGSKDPKKLIGAIDAKEVSLDPETAKMLGGAFEEAWALLESSGNPLTRPPHAEETREQLALHIINAARHGEREIARLRDSAVALIEASGRTVSKT
ncbi:MAG TPA: hypothetical protein VFQ27_11620 [Xanthobacteraceae bacterium]|nr:hypothetical protein [Xanthobacteraceae bacterium]